MSGCACVYTDYEPVDRCVDTYPTARKEHTCHECGRSIAPGETYERAACMSEGSASTYKTCTDCLSVRASFFCDGWGYTVIWQDLWEHLTEVVRFGQGVASDCITSLTPAARDKVCDLIEKIWEEWDDEDD